MYDIIKGIIDHTYITQNAGDQQYIYYIAGTVIIIILVWCLDVLRGIFHWCG